MKKFYFDNPMDALIAMKYHGIRTMKKNGGNYALSTLAGYVGGTMGCNMPERFYVDDRDCWILYPAFNDVIDIICTNFRVKFLHPDWLPYSKEECVTQARILFDAQMCFTLMRGGKPFPNVILEEENV